MFCITEVLSIGTADRALSIALCSILNGMPRGTEWTRIWTVVFIIMNVQWLYLLFIKSDI